jgi:hypothetical protein
MDWATFWAMFSQTHLVTLVVTEEAKVFKSILLRLVVTKPTKRQSDRKLAEITENGDDNMDLFNVVDLTRK